MSCVSSFHQLSIRCEHTEPPHGNRGIITMVSMIFRVIGFMFLFQKRLASCYAWSQPMGFFVWHHNPLERRWTPALNAWNSQVWHLSAHQVLKASIGIPMEKCTTLGTCERNFIWTCLIFGRIVWWHDFFIQVACVISRHFSMVCVQLIHDTWRHSDVFERVYQVMIQSRSMETMDWGG